MPLTPLDHELCLLAAPDDRGAADRLAALLAPHARLFHAGSLAPGDDASARWQRALERSGVRVLLISRTTPLDGGSREALAMAINHARRDPSRKVVPVYLDEASERAPTLYGLQILTRISVTSLGGLEAVAEALRSVVAGLRVQWDARARVAVVAVSEELGGAQRQVVERLGRMQAVEEALSVDAASADAAERAAKADWRLLLVGGRPGRGGVLAQLASAGADCLKLDRVDSDNIDDQELAEAKPLRKRIPSERAFDKDHEAADRAQALFDAWLSSWAPRDPGHSSVLVPWERKWLEASWRRWMRGTYGGVTALAGGKEIDRAQMYVSLQADPTPGLHALEDGSLLVETDEAAARGRIGDQPRHGLPTGETGLERGEERSMVAPFLERVLSDARLPHLAIEGEAGAGKSVLLQHVAYALAMRHLGQPVPESELSEDGLRSGAPLLRVPILVEAQALARRVPRGVCGELLPAIAEAIREVAGETVDEGELASGVAAGRYLLLIDSLDEVPDLGARSRLLGALDSAIDRRDWSLRVVLTSRPTAHTGVALEGRRLRVVRIARLDEERIDRLVDRFVAVGQLSDDVARELRAAIAGVRDRHPGSDGEPGLVENPQLLTCTMLVFVAEHGRLPDSTAELFKRMVYILAAAKPDAEMSTQTKLALLRHVSYRLQQASGTRLPAREVAEAIHRLSPSTDVDAALGRLDRLAAQTGLLRFEEERDRRGRRVTYVRPWHRSFLQYLAAGELAAAAESVAEMTEALLRIEPGAERPRIVDPAWEGVIDFLPGVLGDAGAAKAAGYLRHLFEQAKSGFQRAGARTLSTHPARLLALAGGGVVEYPEHAAMGGEPGLPAELRSFLAERFAVDGGTWPVRHRIAALEALGRLGDPRLNEDPWVELPGGEFTMGDGAVGSAPSKRASVAPFAIFRRPITVADYAPFVEEGGYQRMSLWDPDVDERNLGEPDDWRRQLRHPTHPVTGVSWFEARAFCRWATDAWRRPVSLPSDSEWEYAARRATERPFPWGGDEPGAGEAARANYLWDGEDRLLRPTPVGSFPLGDTLEEGIVDLVGNVGEWIETPWTIGRAKMGPTDENGDPLQQVRGGSWVTEAWLLRSAGRPWWAPRSRVSHVGFRVVSRHARKPDCSRQGAPG